MSITVSEIWRLEFFLEIFACKKEHFCKFWSWPTLSRSSVTRIRHSQTYFDHFGENLIKICWCWRYSTFFFFQMAHFPPWNWRRGCVTTPAHAAHFFVEPEYLDLNPQTVIELVEQLRNRTTVFSTPPGKGGKESNILWKKYNCIPPPAYRINDLLEFAIIFLRYPLAQPFKKGKSYVSRGKNRIGGIWFANQP